jgi:F-box interacting protein
MLAHHHRQPSLPVVQRERMTGLFRDIGDRAYYQPFWPNRETGQYVHAVGDGFVVVGVLCRFYICNPTIRQLAPLPQPEFQPTNTILGLYRHDATGEYRVLWSSVLDWRKQNGKKLHVIAVGHNQSRNIQVKMSSTASMSPSREQALLEKLPRDLYYADNAPVHYRGSLHWMSNCRAEIIVFDTATELFRCICMCGATNSDSSQELFDVHGNLGLCIRDNRFTYMDVWAMEDYEAEIWEFKYRIATSSIEVSRSLDLASLKKEMMIVITGFATLNERELLIGFSDEHVLRCNIDGKLLGSANIGRRQYNMELTQHRLKESIIPIPSSEMQEER